MPTVPNVPFSHRGTERRGHEKEEESGQLEHSSTKSEQTRKIVRM